VRPGADREYASRAAEFPAGGAPVKGAGSASMREVTFAAGETVFEQGDAGDYGLFILEGMVEVRRLTAGSTITLARMGPGALFGELALFDSRPRVGTAVALEPTTCIVLAPSDVRKGLAPLDPLARMIVDSLVGYVRTSVRLLDQTTAELAVLEPAPAEDIDFDALVQAILAEKHRRR
jgi:CRP-like cAMP-binding protein